MKPALPKSLKDTDIADWIHSKYGREPIVTGSHLPWELDIAREHIRLFAMLKPIPPTTFTFEAQAGCPRCHGLGVVAFPPIGGVSKPLDLCTCVTPRVDG